MKLSFDSNRIKSFEGKMRSKTLVTSIVLPLRVRSLDIDNKMITSAWGKEFINAIKTLITKVCYHGFVGHKIFEDSIFFLQEGL